MQDREADNNEVTLVLRDSRVKARKDKLARNSLYFAALFSANFKDHQQKDFEVNYDISLTTLQTFVDWANNEDENARIVHSSKYHFDVRVSLEKFLTGSHSELLDLLNLSVVFAAERLTENITEMIICMRLHPDAMMEVWPLADDLDLKVLRDVALATCLDRFKELSLASILKLSKENFLRLVLNANVNSSSDHVLYVIEAWKNSKTIVNSFFTLDQPNNTPSVQVQASKSPNAIDLPEWDCKFSADPIELITRNSNCLKRIYETVKPQLMPCGVARKLDNALFIWAWNGERLEFEEIAEMTDSQMHTTLVDNGKEIVGRQVIGRAFSIYVIGGELGMGTGRFNTTLWRYCLFSKKWYIETILPQPRRHMAVAFLKNKLYLFGGVGRHRLKLSSVDVYDIHTGIWSQGADIPETFTEVPASCVADGKFVYNKSFIYVYDPTSDEWKHWLPHEENDIPIQSMIACGYYAEIRRMLFCIEIIRSDSPCELELQMIPFEPHEKLRPGLFFHRWCFEDDSHVIYHQMWSEPWFLSFGCKDDRPYVEVGRLTKIGSYCPLDTDNTISESFCGFSKASKNLSADCFKYRLGCFNIIDPHTLHRPINSALFKLWS